MVNSSPFLPPSLHSLLQSSYSFLSLFRSLCCPLSCYPFIPLYFIFPLSLSPSLPLFFHFSLHSFISPSLFIFLSPSLFCLPPFFYLSPSPSYLLPILQSPSSSTFVFCFSPFQMPVSSFRRKSPLL